MPYAQQSPYGAAPVRTSRPHRKSFHGIKHWSLCIQTCVIYHVAGISIILCVASGPEGANLFILNLPPDATDDTLRSIFGPYGNVVSTLVYMDKITKMSKQFGLSQSLFWCIIYEIIVFLQDLLVSTTSRLPTQQSRHCMDTTSTDTCWRCRSRRTRLTKVARRPPSVLVFCSIHYLIILIIFIEI